MKAKTIEPTNKHFLRRVYYICKNKIKVMNKKTLLVSVFAVVTLASCKKTEETKESHGINLEYMDKSVKPGDDFFRYVNGTWYDQTEIPDDRTRWGSFDELRQNTDKDALEILKEAAENQDLDPKSDQAKAVAIYETYLDEAKRNELGVEPLKPYVEKINAVQSPEDVNNLINKLADEGGLGIYSIYVYADAKDSNENAVYISTGSLGLPDRDYYVLDDADMKEKREQYVAHIARMLEMSGESAESAAEDAKRVLAIETKMAEPRLTRVERRDSRLTYNPMTIAELQTLSKNVNWQAFIDATGLKNVDKVIVSQPKYMEALNSILSAENIADIKAYLKWTLVNGSASILSTDMEKANWEFYSKTLQGAKEQRPVEERALAVVNGTVGEALGQLYVAKKFPPEAKEKAQAMIKNVLTAFGERI